MSKRGQCNNAWFSDESRDGETKSTALEYMLSVQKEQAERGESEAEQSKENEGAAIRGRGEKRRTLLWGVIKAPNPVRH